MDYLNDLETVLAWCAIIAAIIGVWHLCVWFAKLIGLADDLGDEPSPASSRMAATWPSGAHSDIDRTDGRESGEPSVPVGFSPHRALPDISQASAGNSWDWIEKLPSHESRPTGTPTQAVRVTASSRARGEYANTTGLRVAPKDEQNTAESQSWQ